jgi:predicted ATPase
MRVDKLLIKDFKNLRNVLVDFDAKKERTVLVGRNGVGKTNLLEALTWIFRTIELREKLKNEKPSFGFRINYQCNGHLVEVDSTRDNPTTATLPSYKLTYKLGKGEEPEQTTMEELSESAFYRVNADTRILPRNIFGYYSGTSNRLRDLFQKHEERYRDALIRGDNQTIRYLFLAKADHSQFVLLSFFAKRDKDIREFLKTQFSISGLDSILFGLKEPYWNQDNPSEERRKNGDDRFWYAAGKVKTLLGDLYETALAPMRVRERLPVGIKTFESKELVYCFLRGEKDVAHIAKGIDQKELFRRLESTQLSDLLRKLWIFFKVEGEKDALSFDDLSEGEQQLLTVLGLLRFTTEDESLFLLDEPDTHLNPAWCLDYLDILRQFGGGLSRSQIIMTTHSPIVFAGLTKEEVILMQKKDDGQITAMHPDSDPRGMGFSAILTSDFFGLRSILDKQTLKDLEEKRRLGGLEKRSPEQEAKLAHLNETLRTLDFTNVVRDPLYKEFVEAMSAESPRAIQKPVLSTKELSERRKLVRRVLTKLQPK